MFILQLQIKTPLVPNKLKTTVLQNDLPPVSTIVSPILAGLVFFFEGISDANEYNYLISAAIIMGVLSAVYHAEVVAHKAGEPYGTLILAIAITVIEVSLIVSLMLAGGDSATELARDTVFAAIMVILTGIIGLCLLLGGYRYREQRFGKHAVGAALVTLTAISVLTLVLPNYTTSALGPVYSTSQLVFIAIVSLVLYGSFVAVQTGRHREYFLPEAGSDEDTHAPPPSKRKAWISFILLLISITTVVLLAKSLAPFLEDTVEKFGAPKSLVGVIVAVVILLPEGVAALRAAQKNRLQTSLNLALGSALASIGLTIPSVAIVSIFTGMTVTLGIDTKSMVLLVLAFFTNMLSFGSGRTTVLQGVVLLVIFAVYLFTTIVP
jgi:Ca2+:H+ antiporter